MGLPPGCRTCYFTGPMSAMKIFIVGLIPLLEECCWIIPRKVVNMALGLSDLLKKKKRKLLWFLTCLNTVIVLNSVRLGILVKVAMLSVLSLTSVLTAINFQRNYLNIKSWEIGSNKCLNKIWRSCAG